MSKKVFVGNLSYDTNEEGIRNHFSQAGTVVDIRVPVNRDTGRPRGFAFVTFSDETEASQAMEKFNGVDLDGRALRVDIAEEQQRPRHNPQFMEELPPPPEDRGGRSERGNRRQPKNGRTRRAYD